MRAVGGSPSLSTVFGADTPGVGAHGTDTTGARDDGASPFATVLATRLAPARAGSATQTLVRTAAKDHASEDEGEAVEGDAGATRGTAVPDLLAAFTAGMAPTTTKSAMMPATAMPSASTTAVPTATESGATAPVVATAPIAAPLAAAPLVAAAFAAPAASTPTVPAVAEPALLAPESAATTPVSARSTSASAAGASAAAARRGCRGCRDRRERHARLPRPEFTRPGASGPTRARGRAHAARVR